MKFWQLTSGFRSEPAVLDAVFADAKWSTFRDWYAQLDSIVKQQDREILDSKVPDSLVRAVAKRSEQMFRLSSGSVRSSRHSHDGELLSALEVVDRFGGWVIEDVNEHGSVNVGGQIR